MTNADDKIKDIELAQEEKLAKEIAKKNSLTYLSLRQAQKPLSIIDKKTAQYAQAAIIDENKGILKLVIHNPKNKDTQELIKHLESQYKQVLLFVVSEPTIERLLKNYPSKEAEERNITDEIEITKTDVDALRSKNMSLEDFGKKFQDISKKDTSMALELLLEASIGLNATDIHVEPQENEVISRIKIDGILYEITTLDQHVYDLLLSRIKLLSGLKLNVHNEAQEGNFSINFANRNVEVRTSILPSQYGEDIALRILDPESILSLEELGMRRDILDELKSHLKAPQGLILATGPTGSGKTTTLYACINFIKTSGIKIITIEDPIEYKLDGITQTEVDKDDNYTFASGLRAILRQDPDTLLLSEIRDLDAADPALQASLAGRKVFSTLHTIDAAGTSSRLIDMGVDPATISSALAAAISQRLVRKLCESCKKQRKITNEELVIFKEQLRKLSQKIDIPTLDENSELYDATNAGCERCGNTGYKGMIGVFEILSATKKIKEYILNNPSEEEMRRHMEEEGASTMMQDSILKILQGITSIGEVERVLGTINTNKGAIKKTP